MKYDLEERTAKFAESIIDFVPKLKISATNNVLVGQLVRSATSIGANYGEANGASSRKDFRNKILLCKKESIETKYWLRILIKNNPDLGAELKKLRAEVHELILIFSKIASNTSTNLRIKTL